MFLSVKPAVPFKVRSPFQKCLLPSMGQRKASTQAQRHSDECYRGHHPMRSPSPHLHHTAVPTEDVSFDFSMFIVSVGSSSVRSLLCVVGECYVGPLCFPDSSVSSKSPLNPLSKRGVSWDPLRQKQQQSVPGRDRVATNQVAVAWPCLSPGPWFL